jgi:D-alanyl-D-alanine carboxypeptidase
MADFQEAFARLDEYVKQKMQADQIPGLSLALTDREHLLRVSTYGFADLAARAPVTPETVFAIASIGKSFTSIALLQEQEVGRLDLHAPVTRYLPWFAVQSAYEPITVHHLMNHTAGIIRGTDFAPAPAYEVYALRDTQTGSPPGQHFHYSNVGYKALGILLEAISGQPYGNILQSRILNPLGMTASAPASTHALRRRMAVGYEPLYDDRPVDYRLPFAPAPWLEYRAGDGSPASTPADMASYVRMLLNRGQGPAGRILSEESFALLTQPLADTGFSDAYGYGLGIQQLDGHRCLVHSGGHVGYSSRIVADLDEGIGGALLLNAPADPTPIAEYALRLLRAARQGQALPEPPPSSRTTSIDNARDYVGTYTGAQTFTLLAENGRLLLHWGQEQVALERRGPDAFYVDHPDWSRFLLNFQREEGQVTEACSGPEWYTNERYSGPTTFDYPDAWNAYPGHYRSHNPWGSNVRVVLRKGKLLLVGPSGGERALVPLGDALFRVGKEDYLPERLRFGAIAGGQALFVNLAGCEYYRSSFAD